MYAGLWLRLLSVLRCRVPAVVEEYQYRTYGVSPADVEKVVYPVFKSLWVIGIDHAAKIYPQCVESYAFRPSEFLVDLLVVVGGSTPHFNLVDRIRRDVVAADRPIQSGIPLPCLSLAPARLLAVAIRLQLKHVYCRKFLLSVEDTDKVLSFPERADIFKFSPSAGYASADSRNLLAVYFQMHVVDGIGIGDSELQGVFSSLAAQDFTPLETILLRLSQIHDSRPA